MALATRTPLTSQHLNNCREWAFYGRNAPVELDPRLATLANYGTAREGASLSCYSFTVRFALAYMHADHKAEKLWAIIL